MDKVQSHIKSGNVSSSTDTEMHTFGNGKQKLRHHPPATVYSEEMEDIRVTSTGPLTTSFNRVLPPLQRGRSYEILTATDSMFQDQTGYLSDSSLPSDRQSIARRQDFLNESNETTPLIQQHSPTEGIEEMEKVLDDDNETVSFSSSKHGQKKKKIIVRYGKRVKVIMLFLIMLTSVVSSGHSARQDAI